MIQRHRRKGKGKEKGNKREKENTLNRKRAKGLTSSEGDI